MHVHFFCLIVININLYIFSSVLSKTTMTYIWPAVWVYSVGKTVASSLRLHFTMKTSNQETEGTLTSNQLHRVKQSVIFTVCEANAFKRKRKKWQKYATVATICIKLDSCLGKAPHLNSRSLHITAFWGTVWTPQSSNGGVITGVQNSLDCDWGGKKNMQRDDGYHSSDLNKVCLCSVFVLSLWTFAGVRLFAHPAGGEIKMTMWIICGWRLVLARVCLWELERGCVCVHVHVCGHANLSH